MSLSPSRVATMLDQTAALLAEHGTATTRRVHDLALGATHHTDGPGQRNSISDPTGTAALAPPDPLAQLENRWALALHALDMHYAVVDVDGRNECAHEDKARYLAAVMRGENCEGATWVAQCHDLCWELQHVIYECLPMDREQADEELRERDHLAHRAKDCDACESPTPELRSGYCDACRKRIGRWEQLHPGEPFDRSSFKQMICSDITTGLITRAASPYSPIAKRRIHEDDVA